MGAGSTSVELQGPHKAGGAPRRRRAPTLVGSPRFFWPASGTPWASSGPKMISVKWHVNWTPFSFPLMRFSKTRRKQKRALGSRLIG